MSSGSDDKLAWATAWERSVKGSKYDTNTAGTIRVNLTHIQWAEENIIGGARACGSIAHIIRQKKGDKPASKVESAFVVEREAMKFSVSQIEAMLAFRKKHIGKLGK